MYAAAREAVDRARAGDGPTLIEAVTFRFFGHVFGDPDAYMDEGERLRHIALDPYPRFRAWLVEQGHASAAQLDSIEAENDREIAAAADFAFSSPYPDRAEIYRDVYEQEIAA